MILTGSEIVEMRKAGQLVIEPFDSNCIEPNSCAFHLGNKLIEYNSDCIDSREQAPSTEYEIGSQGILIHPNRFYLGFTREKIGGMQFATELYANHSTAAMGMWVQTSAPLGHVGAVIHWTLEICVAQTIRIYPNMRLGKVCFWSNEGEINAYRGRYINSNSAVASRVFMDQK